MTFDTILIANRGEIACRVMRTARDMGLRTVAVYSDADANAPFVRMADQAVNIGPASAQDSYLRGDKIIAAAKATGAGAIHPGYGFLSENAGFAETCAAHGVTFIGPTPSAIREMGDKAAARQVMADAGVPCVPGYDGEDQSPARLKAEADRIGYPVMIKAVAGGGGRGMRLVQTPDRFDAELAVAVSEAENAFGSGVVIIERAIMAPRHVEFQVFADTQGNVIHLGERDCSVQRRHQKIVEESPCPVMTPDLRDRMGQAAILAARTIGYVGAGTVEFLLGPDEEFYFLEMNTRLQVEHPVTELVTGLDLVAMQIRVAQGAPLELTQDSVRLTGHAIEVRLCAEDPANDFLPATGRITAWDVPTSAGLRVDSGVEAGQEISPFYDSMVAKVIAHGHDREEARSKLLRGLRDTAFFGPVSNLSFLCDVLDQPSFADGQATTDFVGHVYGDGPNAAMPDDRVLALAAYAVVQSRGEAARAAALDVPDELWGWSSQTLGPTPCTFVLDGEPRSVGVQIVPGGAVIDGQRLGLRARRAGRFDVEFNGAPAQLGFARIDDAQVQVQIDGVRYDLTLDQPGAALASAHSGGTIAAPMHGVVMQVDVTPGDIVAIGDRLAVIEAMKMQHEILSDVAGTVSEVSALVAAQMAEGDVMVVIDTEGGIATGQP